MSFKGKVKNGVVVLPPEAQLPEGACVEVIPQALDYGTEPEEQGSTLWERLKDFDGMADDLPSDLAQRLDHYVHGHPRR